MSAIIRFRTLSYFSTGLGWLTCGYLLLRTLSPQSADLCSAILGSNCEYALRGPTAWQFGIPLAGYGLIYFAVISLLLAIGGIRPLKTAVCINAIGVGVSIALSGSLFLGRTPICPFCLLVHGINVVLVFTLVGLSNTMESDEGNTKSRSAHRRWCLIGTLVILGFFVQTSILLFPDFFGRGIDEDKILAEYQSAPQFKINGNDEIVPGSGTGQLVVFSDFQCPFCIQLASSLNYLRESYSGELQVLFKHYPLDQKCNPYMQGELHPKSCEAAWAAEAARNQNKFQEMHDALFFSADYVNPDSIALAANRAGLDMIQFREDWQSEEVKAKVLGDIELAESLGVNGTPTVFLNGRQVLNPNLQVLQFLINHHLKSKTVTSTSK